MSPKVSVIVPVYNVQEYLGQCLDTILLQTLQDIEVICVDDGSTDNSLEILNTYAFFDERIKVIHQENRGLGLARNRGMEDATGEFIIFFDSDDFFHPEMLETMVAKAEEDNSDMVICGHCLFDSVSEKDYSEQKIDEKYLIASPLSPKDYWSDLFSICSAAVWTKLFKREFINKYSLKFFDDKYAEDIPFSYTAMVLSNKISLLEDCFVHYRQKRKGQLTDNRYRHGPAIVIPLMELYDNLKKFKLEKRFLDAYLKRFCHMLAWEISGRLPHEQRDFLNQFIKALSPEVANIVFGYGDHQNKISIVIAAYNATEFLPKCLDSCLNQTLKEIEIICVDDGSIDSTLNVLKEYQKRDGRIKVLTQENQRQSIARYNAMKIASGEYIWYVDADDYLDVDSCECLYLYAKICQLDMLSFSCMDFKNDTGIEYEVPYHTLSWLPEKFIPSFTWRNVYDIMPQLAVTAPLTIYRRDFLESNNIHWLHKKIAYEDTPFFTEAMLKDANMGVFPEKFYHKRTHELATTQDLDNNFPDFCWIVGYTLKLVQKLSLDVATIYIFAKAYLIKVYLNYQRLSPEVQEKMLPYFYKLFSRIVRKYHVILSDEMNQVCYSYLKNKRLKKRLSFYFFSLWAKWVGSRYTVCPINIVFKPNFKLTFLGIPVLCVQEDLSNADSLTTERPHYLKMFGFDIRKIYNLSVLFTFFKAYFRKGKATDNFNIDLVYLWCDGADPQFREQKDYWLKSQEKKPEQQAVAPGRFEQVDELKYALRSVAKYLPWVHRIFIVTANQIPSWLNTKNPKIKVIDHSKIISRKCLPTFNSSAIEVSLYKIPHLSEHFLYSNDDMFIGRPLKPDFFFNNGQPIVRLHRSFLDQRDQWYARLRNIISLAERDFGILPVFSERNVAPHHNIDAYLKSDYANCAKHFQKEYSETQTHRFRQSNSVQRFIVSIYSFVCQHVQLKMVPNCWDKPDTQQTVDSYLIRNHMPETFENFAWYNPALFCVNSSEHTRQKDLMKTKSFLENLFPDKSEFEK